MPPPEELALPQRLREFKALTMLDVRGTKIPTTTIETFARDRPKCKILTDGGVLEPK